MTNCTIFYNTTAKQLINMQSLVLDTGTWYVVSSSGDRLSVDQLNQPIKLMNNFSCPARYTGSVTINLDATELQVCSMHELSRLTTKVDNSINGKIVITNVKNVTLNCLESTDCDIAIDGAATGNSAATFELAQLDGSKLSIVGAKLIIEELNKNLADLTISADQIQINKMTLSYISFLRNDGATDLLNLVSIASGLIVFGSSSNDAVTEQNLNFD